MHVMGTSLEPLELWKKNGPDLPSAKSFGTSVLATLARAGAGTYVARLGARPEQRLTLFEMEGCPYSRKAREALSMLDIDVNVRPCPKGANHHRSMVQELTGEEQVPVLVDPNTGQTIDESEDIVQYLFDQYGDGRVPWQLRLGKATQKSSELASKLRGDPGKKAKPARLPEQTLELWSYEGSPYCRLVRETLSGYALPYVLHNVARFGKSRAALVERTGRMQVPFLHDPNTGAELFETQRIRRYLSDTYGLDG